MVKKLWWGNGGFQQSEELRIILKDLSPLQYEKLNKHFQKAEQLGDPILPSHENCKQPVRDFLELFKNLCQDADSDEKMPPVAEDSPSEQEEVEQTAAESSAQKSVSEDEVNAKRSPVKVMTQSDIEMGLDEEESEQKK